MSEVTISKGILLSMDRKEYSLIRIISLRDPSFPAHLLSVTVKLQKPSKMGYCGFMIMIIIIMMIFSCVYVSEKSIDTLILHIIMFISI